MTLTLNDREACRWPARVQGAETGAAVRWKSGLVAGRAVGRAPGPRRYVVTRPRSLTTDLLKGDLFAARPRIDWMLKFRQPELEFFRPARK